MTAAPDVPDVVRIGRRRPQQLLLSLFGALVLDRGYGPISTRVYLHLLADLGVAEAAARATLTRMTRKGLLDRVRQGRTAQYLLTPAAEDMLRRAEHRVDAAAPFDHPPDEWTLLSYSMPESRRDLRHQIRARLAWAGFGGLRDGLWIAPGTVDVTAVFEGPQFAGLAELADAFTARPVPGTRIGSLVSRAWDVEAIRAEHQAFGRLWTADRAERGRPITRLTQLGADWLQLLRVDPGLPAAHLPADWPAPASAALYRERFAALEPAATEQLERLLRSDAGRR